MPTVLRFDGLRVVVYPNDHRPAHVHVIGRGCEAVFFLNCATGPVELRENYGFSRREVSHIESVLTAICKTFAGHGRKFMALHENFEIANERAKELQGYGPYSLSVCRQNVVVNHV